jgi:DNA-3-methyladenine glycosylase I
VVASFGDDDVARLLADEGIVRNRAKVEASIRNARAWLDSTTRSSYLWGFTDGVTIVQNEWATMDAVPAETERSRR